MHNPSEKVNKIKKVSNEYDEHYSFLKETGSSIDSNSLKPRVHNITHSTNVGKKISTLGIALIAFPDPTISDVVGWTPFCFRSICAEKGADSTKRHLQRI